MFTERLDLNVLNHFIQNSPKLETPQKSISLGMGKQNVAYLYNGVKRNELILAAALMNLKKPRNKNPNTV